MVKKKIAILGSTGSIGKTTFDILKKNKNKFEVILLTSNNNINELIKQAKFFKVKNLVINNQEHYLTLKKIYKNKKVRIYNDINNLKNLTCYSNEENKWQKSEIKFIGDFKIKINLKGKFTSERGRINCSLREADGAWRWLGMQFVVSEK